MRGEADDAEDGERERRHAPHEHAPQVDAPQHRLRGLPPPFVDRRRVPPQKGAHDAGADQLLQEPRRTQLGRLDGVRGEELQVERAAAKRLGVVFEAKARLERYEEHLLARRTQYLAELDLARGRAHVGGREEDEAQPRVARCDGCRLTHIAHVPRLQPPHIDPRRVRRQNLRERARRSCERLRLAPAVRDHQFVLAAAAEEQAQQSAQALGVVVRSLVRPREHRRRPREHQHEQLRELSGARHLRRRLLAARHEQKHGRGADAAREECQKVPHVQLLQVGVGRQTLKRLLRVWALCAVLPLEHHALPQYVGGGQELEQRGERCEGRVQLETSAEHARGSCRSKHVLNEGDDLAAHAG